MGVVRRLAGAPDKPNGPGAGSPTGSPSRRAPYAGGVLSRVAAQLACPVCAQALRADPDTGRVGRLLCPRGHAFDVARQGHVALLPGGHARPGDDAAMVGHRLDFLGAGHYAPIAEALTCLAGDVPREGLLLDVGGGPGWYAARLLDADPTRAGVSLDSSTAAARRAAKAHPRLASVLADGTGRYPLIDGAAAACLSVFAPRRPAEMARVLTAGGMALVVTPSARHLEQARGPLGLLGIDPRKEERLAAGFAGWVLREHQRVRRELALSRQDLTHLALMGPSAFHVDPRELERRLADLLEPFEVTCEVSIRAYAPPVRAGRAAARRTTGGGP